MKELGYLSKEGQIIFSNLQTHCQQLRMMEFDYYDLMSLANSYDVHSKMAKFCNENGYTTSMVTKTGTYEMVRPEYNIMKTELQNIMKMSGKFGLNPGDRSKIFKGLGDKKRKKITDGL